MGKSFVEVTCTFLEAAGTYSPVVFSGDTVLKYRPSWVLANSSGQDMGQGTGVWGVLLRPLRRNSEIFFFTLEEINDLETRATRMAAYQLSATLEGHEQDVKAVAAVDNGRVVSCARDGTVRLWDRVEEEGGHPQWVGRVLYATGDFLNSVCYNPLDQVVYFAGKETIVMGVPLDESNKTVYSLVGHQGNVCCLQARDTQIISGSWDTTAKVWSSNQLQWDLKRHTASVWDAKFITNSKYITVSADKSVIIWEEDTLLKKFTDIHQDVIRSVVVLNEEGTLFATCSNDTTIKIFDINGNITATLEGHESFVYCLAFNPQTNELISCGEDRSLRIWDLTNFQIRQVIRLPAVSLWSCGVLPNGDILVGSSDKLIRIFTTTQDRRATQEQIALLNKEVESTALNSKAIEFDESKLSPLEILNKPGQKEGQIVVVKSPAGVIEAHQFSSNKWTKVGDVVNSSSSDKKIEFEGKRYDYVFDVDIEDGSDPLKLPVNITDNVYEVADKFILKYELPQSYRDQIVNFIISNTQGMSLDSSNETPMQNPITQLEKGKILPVTKFITITNFKPESLFNGIIKINSVEKTFNDEDLAFIGSSLHDLDNNWEILLNFAEIIYDNWSNKLPAFDIMRLTVTKLSTPEKIAKFIDWGLNNKDINIAMLTVRILVNSFENPNWGISLMSSSKTYESVFETIDTLFPDATLRQSENFATSVSTLILNYSILCVREPNKYQDIVPIIAEVLNNKYGVLEEYQTVEENAYRLVIAYGNLSLLEPTLKQFAQSIKWLKTVRQLHSNKERFKIAFEDIL